MIKDFLGRDVVFSDDESIFTVAEILQLAAVESICMFLSQEYWDMHNHTTLDEDGFIEGSTDQVTYCMGRVIE